MKQGWEIKKIGDVCNLMTGGTPSRSNQEYFEGGTIKWLVSGDIHRKEIFDCEGRITELGMASSNAKLLPANSVMIALNGQGKTRGTVALLRTNATCNQSLVSIYPKDIKKVLPEFIFCNLHGRYEEIRKITGDDDNDRRGLNMPLIRNIEIPLPPLPEQQRIVSILDESFAAIEKAKANAEQNLKNAKELFESYLQGVFGGSTSSPTKRDGWEEKRFEELIQENQIGLIKSTKEQDNNKPYRYLKMDSITSGNTLIHDKYVYVDANKNELEKFKLNAGDFLFNTRNSYELVGKTCVFRPIDDEPTLFNNNIMRVVFKKGISSDFINYAFSSELIKERLQKLKSGTTSVVGIYYKGLRNLQIPIVNFEQQQTIIRQLDVLRTETQKLEAIYQKKIDDLEELKKSILQKAFAGELKTERAVAV